MCDFFGMADCFGNLTYAVQRLASCVAAAAVITCMMTTLLIMLAIGVGTGYNYCFVETKLNDTLRAAKGIKKPTKLFCEEDENKPRRAGGGEPVTSNPAPISKRKRRSKELDEPPIFQYGSKVSSDDLNEPKEFQNSSDNGSTTELSIEIKPTMVVPLQHFALVVLIKNLQMKNKNYTLELVAAKF